MTETITATTADPGDVYRSLKELFPGGLSPADVWNILKGVEGLCAASSEAYALIVKWQSELDAQFQEEEGE